MYLLRESLTAYCRSTPLGFLPRIQKIALPNRHLGLTLARESLTAECLAEMVAWVENHIDLDALLAVARKHSQALTFSGKRAEPSVTNVRIAVAHDAAFCFYCQDNLDMLSGAGAELVEFSPVADRELPRGFSGLYLGGGYPELHAAIHGPNGGTPHLATIWHSSEAWILALFSRYLTQLRQAYAPSTARFRTFTLPLGSISPRLQASFFVSGSQIWSGVERSSRRDGNRWARDLRNQSSDASPLLGRQTESAAPPRGN